MSNFSPPKTPIDPHSHDGKNLCTSLSLVLHLGVICSTRCYDSPQSPHLELLQLGHCGVLLRRLSGEEALDGPRRVAQLLTQSDLSGGD